MREPVGGPTTSVGTHLLKRDAERFQRACALDDVPMAAVVRALVLRWTAVRLGDVPATEYEASRPG